MSDQLIAVYALAPDQHTLLGYAIGDKEDILAYFEEHDKGWGLELEEATPLRLPPGYRERLVSLIARREAIELELKEINRKIKYPTPA